MKRSTQLVVIDRRYVLRGMAATLAASLLGCRISLDSAPEPGSSSSGGGGGGGGGGGEPDAGTPAMQSGSGSGSGSDAGMSMCGGDVCLDLSAPENAALQSVDGARILDVNGHQVLVVRLDAATFIALSAVCTHQGCIVKYAPSGHDVQCPCHGSLFGMDGHVIQGPAALPLASYQTAFDDGAQMLTITI